MPVNNGVMSAACNDDDDAFIRVYYDKNWLINNPNADPNDAPLVDGPPAPNGNRYCYYTKNTSGMQATGTVEFSTGLVYQFGIQKGDPVTTGPTGGRSRTAAQLAALGITKRGDIVSLGIECRT